MSRSLLSHPPALQLRSRVIQHGAQQIQLPIQALPQHGQLSRTLQNLAASRQYRSHTALQHRYRPARRQLISRNRAHMLIPLRQHAPMSHLALHLRHRLTRHRPTQHHRYPHTPRIHLQHQWRQCPRYQRIRPSQPLLHQCLQATQRSSKQRNRSLAWDWRHHDHDFTTLSSAADFSACSSQPLEPRCFILQTL